MYQNGRPMGSGNFPPALNPAGVIAARRPVLPPLMALNALRETEPGMSGEGNKAVESQSGQRTLHREPDGAGRIAPGDIAKRGLWPIARVPRWRCRTRTPHPGPMTRNPEPQSTTQGCAPE
jgi:hypothetical protein